MSVFFYNAVFGMSCYYMIVSFAFRYLEELGYRTDPFAFGLLMAAALLSALGRSGVWGKRIPALFAIALCLPALALIWNHGFPGVLEYGPPWMYLGYLCCRRPRSLSHRYFKQDFLHFLWIFVLMFLFFFAVPTRGVMALKEAVPYIVIFLTAGVSLLQALRHQQEEVDGFAKNQAKRTSIFFFFSILLTVGGLLEFLEEVFLHRLLLPAVLFLVGQFMELTQSVWNFLEKKLWGLQKDYGDFQLDMEAQRAGRERLQYEPEPILTGHTGNPLKRMEINYMFLAVLVVAVAAIVLFLVLRSNKKKSVPKMLVLDEREVLPDPMGTPGKSGRKASPQETIRKHYQKFMQAVDGKSKKLAAQDTTKEIREKYLEGKKDGRAAAVSEELTEIYRLSRYHEKQGVVDGMDLKRQAKRMKILLDYLRKM